MMERQLADAQALIRRLEDDLATTKGSGSPLPGRKLAAVPAASAGRAAGTAAAAVVRVRVVVVKRVYKPAEPGQPERLDRPAWRRRRAELTKGADAAARLDAPLPRARLPPPGKHRRGRQHC